VEVQIAMTMSPKAVGNLRNLTAHYPPGVAMVNHSKQKANLNRLALDEGIVASKFSASIGMKRYLPFIIVVGVALVTFGSGAMLYRTKHEQLQAIPEDKALSANSGSESPHIRGNPNAQVTLEEFGDFQCPPCGSFAGFAEELLKEYDSRLRIVFRHFPLTAHEHAREASLAAEAAGIQGRFWEMHDLLYREQAAWSKAPNARELFESYAGTIGLNVDQFKKDMDGEQAKARVDSDHARAESLEIKVTPSLYINGQPVDAKDKNPEGVRAAINAALAGKPHA
jgi:Protein-disulfide isomerase